MPALPCGADEMCAGQVRREMLANRHRAHAGAASAVRNAERLVQVQVRHVRAELARLGEPDQGVEVGAVDVDLPAGVVHLRAQRGDAGLVDASLRNRRSTWLRLR